MYIEASNMVYGQKAQLISRLLRGTSRPQCLIFFYHMYGAGTGILNVYVKKHGEKAETLLWRRRGEQSITWLRGLIEYTCDTYHQVSQHRTDETSYKKYLLLLNKKVNSLQTPVHLYILQGLI